MTRRIRQPVNRVSCRIGRGWLHPHRSRLSPCFSFSRRLQVASHIFFRFIHLRGPDSVTFQHYHVLVRAKITDDKRPARAKPLD